MGSTVRSTGYMVLHRPVEPAPRRQDFAVRSPYRQGSRLRPLPRASPDSIQLLGSPSILLLYCGSGLEQKYLGFFSGTRFELSPLFLFDEDFIEAKILHRDLNN